MPEPGTKALPLEMTKVRREVPQVTNVTHKKPDFLQESLLYTFSYAAEMMEQIRIRTHSQNETSGNALQCLAMQRPSPVDRKWCGVVKPKEYNIIVSGITTSRKCRRLLLFPRRYRLTNSRPLLQVGPKSSRLVDQIIFIAFERSPKLGLFFGRRQRRPDPLMPRKIELVEGLRKPPKALRIANMDQNLASYF